VIKKKTIQCSILFFFFAGNAYAESAIEQKTLWENMFKQPERICLSLNEKGFSNSSYKSANFPPPNFQCSGTLVTLGKNESTVMDNNMGLYVYGSKQEVSDDIHLKININQPKYVETAIKDAKGILEGFFKTFDITSPKQLIGALSEGKELNVANPDGSKTIVEVKKFANGGESRLIILLRSGAERTF
jgi:Family of unknown function (DUF6030)